jgi:DNA modification methylase
MANEIVVRQGDNLSILREIKANSVRLIYIDPPYNTGKEQALGAVRGCRVFQIYFFLRIQRGSYAKCRKKYIINN